MHGMLTPHLGDPPRWAECMLEFQFREVHAKPNNVQLYAVYREARATAPFPAFDLVWSARRSPFRTMIVLK